jgi:3-isopropylmalate dehydratase small subunit
LKGKINPVKNTKALREENKISNGVDKIQDGDVLEIDLSSGIIKNITQNQTYKTQAFPEFLQEIVKQGGLMSWIKTKLRR